MLKKLPVLVGLMAVRAFTFPQRSLLFSKFHCFHSKYQSTSLCDAKRTEYTIDYPPTDRQVLTKIVEKHIKTRDKYDANKPIAAHTAKSYETLSNQLLENGANCPRKMVLDSGCGTGRSSLLLGSLYPDHIVVGVDQSIARLSRSPYFVATSDSKNDTVKQVAVNVWLVRAELVDFWRCCLRKKDWSIEHHYLLYPNPYPKRATLKHRWYAHASFPFLLELQAKTITLRSNWEQYLVEFRDSMYIAAECYQSLAPSASNPAQLYTQQDKESLFISQQHKGAKDAWTNFEEKYLRVGEATYELVFQRQQSCKAK